MNRSHLNSRSSGILLHPTSLPGKYDFGDIGAEAQRFAEFLETAGQRWWQMCPLNPTVQGGSPYSAISAFAGNPSLISLEGLVDEGWLLHDEIAAPSSKKGPDFSAFAAFKLRCFDTAFKRFQTKDQTEFESFKAKNAYWLNDYVLFSALRKHYGKKPWTEWPASLRRRDPDVLLQVTPNLAASRHFNEFVQFVFFRQWGALKAVCAKKGIGLLGDTSIYIAHDSADVWAHQSYFDLDAKGKPASVGGTPPDLFTTDGQSWGMPTYRWDLMERDGYHWWIERFKAAFEIFDAVRLDHFIGYTRHWRIPASSKSAKGGEWAQGPGADFFNAVIAGVPDGQFVAEDLGAMGKDVAQVRDQFGFPGMKVLQFAFAPELMDPTANTFLPENHRKEDVVYTGTHDNNTSVGWYKDLVKAAETDSAKRAELALLMKYVRSADDIHWKLIELALNSKANTAIFPLQDVLGLDTESRLNNPGQGDSNWKWRFQWNAITPETTEKLRELTKKAGRL